MIETSENIKVQSNESTIPNVWRNSTQPLLPPCVSSKNDEGYHPATFHAIGDGKIFSGYESLCEWIIGQKTVLIDGFIGVFFKEIEHEIENALLKRGFSVNWCYANKCYKSEQEIDELVKPFLGEKADVWGTKCTLEIRDFINTDALSKLKADETKDINIVIGIGAGLLQWDAAVVYFDIPKNEIQYRMRAKSVANLGKGSAERSFDMYKRFYFVDWVVLNAYKCELLDRISVVADGQWLNEVNWLFKTDLVNALNTLSHSVLRARTWFERGSWGGQWIKEHLTGINKDEINYAWSFELITPENGLVLESDGNLLEVAFDFLMLYESKAILGKHAEQFGTYFPIRFDFLDTFQGGNLSIQCHPSKTYIQEKFGETITQDETYYILDCEPEARVYLGFQEDIDPGKFRLALENSQKNNEELAIDTYVQSFPSHKHDLFLIPNGTVHSSGMNNMVLEISATPYIFTFKMYDWLSLDLNGKPRPINIEHAFNNLRFERKGKRVEEELISHPALIDSGENWELIHLPTHIDHFYDVHRIEFDSDVVIHTDDVCHVLMLVEGASIGIEIDGELIHRFNYAQTFIVPAATMKYKLVNFGRQKAKVIKAFLK